MKSGHNRAQYKKVGNKQQNVSICQHNFIEHVNITIYFLEYIACATELAVYLCLMRTFGVYCELPNCKKIVKLTVLDDMVNLQ